MIGESIAHFEITAKIGEGGMGEVYQATDTRLNREVALKILPQSFALDPQRMGRFQREAQVLASLNHPNIAQIYGLETQDSGPGTAAESCLVMELVEGEDLSERIARGPIPLEEALPIALQIAEALEDAHEKGIIHRDLKPANIKLTPEGKVKVLDFGLARAVEEERGAENIANSPTLTMQATQAGLILGTAAYMAPEQAKGKPVDKRTDIWAFGAVLYEMLSGNRAFEGDDLTEILASVVKVDVDWDRFFDDLPPLIIKMLRRCLQANPRQRLHDIADFRLEIEGYLADPSDDSAIRRTVIADSPPSRQRFLPWALVVLSCLVSFATLWFLWPTPAAPEPPRRLNVDLGVDAKLGLGGPTTSVTLSPDESILAFTAQVEQGDEFRLYLRRLDQLEAIPLSGTEGAIQHTFSPDGQWLVFRADRALKKVAVNGGAAITLCETGGTRGISWGDDDSIVFASSGRGGLSRVSSMGGIPEPLTTLAEPDVTHRWPQMLPGGKAVLFTASSTPGQYDNADIVVRRLPDGEKKILWQGGYQGRYLPSGHLLYAHRGTLFAAPFDLEALEIRGQPVPILEGVMSSPDNGSSQFAFSERGTLVYVPGGSKGAEDQLEWVDGEGNRQPLQLEPTLFGTFRLSPSGRLLALEINDGTQVDIWIYDTERDTLTRLTFDPADDNNPVWSPSSESIVFASERDGVSNLYWKRADGSGEAQRLTESQNRQRPHSWHPDGHYLAFQESITDQAEDLRILALDGSDHSGWTAGETTTFLSTPFPEWGPQFSPDGRWLSYVSSETGSWEIFVRPFPGPGGKWQISSGRGVWPQWSTNGQNLFFSYGSPGEMYRVKYRFEGNSFVADRPEKWESGSFYQRSTFLSCNLHPDGQRFLLRKQVGEDLQQDLDHIVLFQNFFDYMREKVQVDQ